MAEAMSRAGDGEEAGGEGYFASISDLMVGVLFVFLLMLTVLALNFQTSTDEAERLKREAAEQKIEAERQKWEADQQRRINEELRQQLRAILDRLKDEIAARDRARSQMLAELKERLVDRGVRVEIDERSGVLRLAERDLRFASRSADLDEKARRTVRMLGEVFAQVLPCFAQGSVRTTACAGGDASILETVLVEGHTDKRPVSQPSSFKDNYQLSAERALAVYRVMMSDQPRLLDLRNPGNQPLLAVSGYGETRPIEDAQGDSDTDLERNRRIDVRFVLSSRTADEIHRLMEQVSRALGTAP